MSKKKLPNFKVYKDRTQFRVKWWSNNKPYMITFHSKDTAQLAIAQIKLALAGSQPWPPELISNNVIQKFIKEQSSYIKPMSLKLWISISM